MSKRYGVKTNGPETKLCVRMVSRGDTPQGCTTNACELSHLYEPRFQNQYQQTVWTAVGFAGQPDEVYLPRTIFGHYCVHSMLQTKEGEQVVMNT